MTENNGDMTGFAVSSRPENAPFYHLFVCLSCGAVVLDQAVEASNSAHRTRLVLPLISGDVFPDFIFHNPPSFKKRRRSASTPAAHSHYSVFAFLRFLTNATTFSAVQQTNLPRMLPTAPPRIPKKQPIIIRSARRSIVITITLSFQSGRRAVRQPPVVVISRGSHPRRRPGRRSRPRRGYGRRAGRRRRASANC